MFKKYPHVERLDSDECQGILIGTCRIEEKIDGSNGSIWFNKDTNQIMCASRNCILSLHNSNRGFYQYVMNLENELMGYFSLNPDAIIYGEWLVKHNINYYLQEAYNHFYCFDIAGQTTTIDIDFIKIIPAITIINPTLETLNDILKDSSFLLDSSNKGKAEGLVIKNKSFINKFNRHAMGKLINPLFSAVSDEKYKEKDRIYLYSVEEITKIIAYECVSYHLIKKEYAKLNKNKDPRALRAQLANICVHLAVTEELWKALKHYRMPTIDFLLFKEQIIQKVFEALDSNILQDEDELKNKLEII